MLLYHYTSLKTFHDIVKNVLDSKDKEKSFAFWASSSFCLNDIAELKYGYGVLTTLLPLFEDDVDDMLRLSNLEEQTRILGKSPNYVSELIKNNAVIMEKMPFVISFSYMPDYLPMWYMYADRCKGVCMGFEMEEMKSESRQIWPVIYNFERIEKGYKELINETIKNMYSEYLKRTERIRHDINLLWAEKMSTIRIMCTLMSPIFKHPAFEFEDEYRLVQYGCEDNVKRRQTEKGMVVSYVNIKIPFEALKKVIIGPCADNMVFHAIQTELKYCNPQHLVEVETSLLPYRNI